MKRKLSSNSTPTPRGAFPRNQLSTLLTVVCLVTVNANASDVQRQHLTSKHRKAARKEAVRAAAAASASTGRGESAFVTPDYGLSEESKTPNFHTRQEEGLRTSGGA